MSTLLCHARRAKPKPGNGSEHNRSDSQQDQASRYTVDDGQYLVGFMGEPQPEAKN